MLKVDIEQNGDVTNAQIVQRSGIKRLDLRLLNNVVLWKYAPRPGFGVLQSNLAVTIDWMATN